MRIILFTGKGGVGKTTISAATAVKCAELGYRTVVLSTDPAPSLGDCFERRLSTEPEKLLENLYALEVDAQKEVEHNFGVIRQYFVDFMQSKGFDETFSNEVIIFPGFDEMFGLLKILHLAEDNYDVLIIDSAPTGNTFRFLAFPEVISMLRRAVMADRYLVKAMRPFQRFLSQPLPPDAYFEQTDGLAGEVTKVRNLLGDNQLTSVRLVTMPQRLVISETRRALTFLSLFGYNTDSVIINQIIPDGVTDAHFKDWKDLQKQYLDEIEQSFSPIHIAKLDHLPNEPVGITRLKEVADRIYGETDPSKEFSSGQPLVIEQHDTTTVITIKIPFVVGEELGLHRRADVLQIDVGSYRRLLALPYALIDMEVEDAELSGDTVKITFARRRSPLTL